MTDTVNMEDISLQKFEINAKLEKVYFQNRFYNDLLRLLTTISFN